MPSPLFTYFDTRVVRFGAPNRQLVDDLPEGIGPGCVPLLDPHLPRGPTLTGEVRVSKGVLRSQCHPQMAERSLTGANEFVVGHCFVQPTEQPAPLRRVGGCRTSVHREMEERDDEVGEIAENPGRLIDVTDCDEDERACGAEHGCNQMDPTERPSDG